MTRSRIRRILIVSCLALVAAQVVVLWRATGQGILTRYFDPNRAALERASRDIAAIFDDDSDRFLDDAPNRFRLGLLPAGEDEHAVSVVTLLTPLLLAAALMLSDWRAEVTNRASPLNETQHEPKE